MFFSVSVPVGLVLGGWLTGLIGPRVIFFIIGAFLVLSSMWGIVVNRIEESELPFANSNRTISFPE